MALYESTFIARQEISTADVEKLTAKVLALVKKHGGNVVKNEYWGVRDMAYPVKKAKKGHYVHLGIDAPGALAGELEENYRLTEDILRNLTVRVDNISKEPSAILNTSDHDDDSSGGGFDRDGSDHRPHRKPRRGE